MFLRHILSAAVLMFTAGLCAGAQTFTEWKDPRVNSHGRAPMHTSYFAYESPEAALLADPAASSNYLPLNGKWKFAWAENAWERPTDFFREDYDDGYWDEMSVPGVWELNGYGDPVYLNVGYAWRNQYRNNPPLVPEKGNHVGSYRRVVEIPAGWSARATCVPARTTSSVSRCSAGATAPISRTRTSSDIPVWRETATSTPGRSGASRT